MKQYVMVGLAALAGAAVLEAAIIPGLVIGGAAVLAPSYIPKLRRRLQPLFGSAAEPKMSKAAAGGEPHRQTASNALARLGIGQAVAKTITFRIIVTTLDFTTNYIVIGELATAAGLSTFNLIVGPLFYLAHETAWNYYGPAEDSVALRKLLLLPVDADHPAGPTVSRSLAKTITFRTFATVMDFTTNYVVVGDALTAAGLSAFAFVVGPFVYLGHEKVWDYYGSPRKSAPDQQKPINLLPPPTKLLPAPG
jgi:uncharacterized membrane protein